MRRRSGGQVEQPKRQRQLKTGSGVAALAVASGVVAAAARSLAVRSPLDCHCLCT